MKVQGDFNIVDKEGNVYDLEGREQVSDEYYYETNPFRTMPIEIILNTLLKHLIFLQKSRFHLNKNSGTAKIKVSLVY